MGLLGISGGYMVGRKEIHDKLWEARNEEINHLWQRSIFLAAFLTVLITVYFTFAGSVLSDSAYKITNTASLSSEGPQIEIALENTVYEKYRNLLILDILSVVGFSFSVLWICMARGSKLSYERIEEGINKAYEGGFFDEELSNAIKKDFIENLFAFGDYTYTPMHGSLPDPDYSFRYFAVEGSKHSLSKVNILIGYVFMALWIMTAVANPFIVDTGMFVPSYLFSGIWMVIVFKFLFKCSASDGYGTFRIQRVIRKAERGKLSAILRYLHIMKTDDAYLNPQKLQDEYIASVLSAQRLISWHTKEHAMKVFEKYSARCGHKLTYPLIKNLIDEMKSNNVEVSLVRAFENDSFLKNMLETAIMYRTEIPLNFRGRWICRKNNLTISLSRYSFTIDRLNVIAQDYSLNHIGGSFLLFADNMWHRIRSGSWSFEDCFLRSSVIHLLTEESDGAKLYIKLSLPDSLSSDIASSAVERMDAEVCRIDNSGTLSSNSFVFYRV